MTRSALISIAMSLFAACTSTDGGGDGGGGNGGGGGGGGASEGTTCAQVLDCIDTCSTDACANNCVADGSNEAQDQINDLAACIEQSTCTDPTCISQQCSAELTACGGDLGGGGGGQQGTPLPAQLVGTWDHTAAGVSITFQLTADGRVSKVAGLFTGSGSCSSSFVFQYDGIVELDGDRLSFLPTTGSFTSYGCDGTTPTNSGPRTDPEHFRFALGSDATGPLLQLQTIDTGNIVEYRRQ
jgi:hypothetical protein